jgi:hypothetical protein
MLNVTKNAPTALKQFLTGVSQSNAAIDAREELHAHVGFKPVDPARERRLGLVENLGRMGDAAKLSDFYEASEADQIH